MDWGENPFHDYLDDPCNFLQSSDEYFHAQDMSFLTPLGAKRKLFKTGGAQIQGSEAEHPWQICQNQPEQEPMQAIHHARPAGKLNSETRCLTEQKVNILRDGTESEVCNLKGKAPLGSKTPVTPIERKRINDKNYRDRERVKKQKLQQQNKNLHKKVERLSQQNAQQKDMIEQLTCDQPKSSLLKRKAKFQLNCHDEESKKEAMNLVFDNFSGIDNIRLKRGKRILELKGSFDAEAVLRMLNRVCDTHLLSKKNVPSRPGPSTLAYLSVSAVKLR